MPAKFTDKDNLEFVCSCIKYSKNGICNFEAVSKELRLTSKYAAEQRFSRLMRQHGVTTGLRGMTDKVEKRKKQEGPDGWDTPLSLAGIDPKLGRPRKKRKLRQVTASTADDDDDEPLVKGEVKCEDDIRVKSELGNIGHGGSTKWPGPDGQDDDDIMIVGSSEKTEASTSIPTANSSPGFPEMVSKTSRTSSRQISHEHHHHNNDILSYTTLVPDPVHAWYYHQYQPNLPHDVYHQHNQHHTPGTSENHWNHAGSHEPEEHLDKDRNGRS
ncbi:hypothetical protein PG995_014615 [Apiospora arundinis]